VINVFALWSLIVALRGMVDVKATRFGTNVNGLRKRLAIQSQPVSCWPHCSCVDRAFWLQVDFQSFLHPERIRRWIFVLVHPCLDRRNAAGNAAPEKRLELRGTFLRPRKTNRWLITLIRV